MSILASLEPARRVAADPCALLTKEEIAEELLQAAEGVYHVLKGGHAATIGNFPGRTEGGAGAGRIALLGRIAEGWP